MAKMQKARDSQETQTGGARTGLPVYRLLAAVLVLAAIAATYVSVGDGADPITPVGRFSDVGTDTMQFIAYNQSVTLTPVQETIFEEALTGLKAPCCSDRTAHTCCCPCNMARSWWGLSKHLIADEGYDAYQVRSAVRDWFAYINPNGFSGKACYTGGCERPFHLDGCGGMSEDRLVL